MAVSTVGLACGLLGGLCAIALIFFWWWFPRTWKKGNAEEAAIVMAQKAERERLREEALERGEGLTEMGDAQVAKPPPTYTYNPPAYASY